IRAGRAATLGGNQRQAVGGSGMGGMRPLVVGQLALAVVVVAVAMLLGRTLFNYMRIDPGFAAERLVTVSLDPMSSGYTLPQIPDLARRLVATANGVPGA